MSDLSTEDQRLAETAVAHLYGNARSVAAPKAKQYLANPNPTAQNTGRRYQRVAEEFPEGYEFSLEKATQARVDAFVEGATTLRKSQAVQGKSGVQHRPEDVAGIGFYFDNMRIVEDAVKNTSVPLDNALEAVGQLSEQAEPGGEKAALRGIVQAEEKGRVRFSPSLVEGMNKAPGPNVPSEIKGHEVAFRDLRPTVAAHLAHPDIRSTAERNVEDVPVGEIAKVYKRQNIKKGIKAVRGAPPDPHRNPKKWGYGESHRLATSEAIEGEYRERGRILGEVARTGMYQDSLDLFGLRKSNEGILSNETDTAEDSWMRTVSISDVDKTIRKAAGDALTLPNKTVGEETIRNRDTRVTPVGIEHAVHHEATVRAAKEVERLANEGGLGPRAEGPGERGIDFTVPSVMMQETGWAVARRRTPYRVSKSGVPTKATADSDFNDYQRAVQAKPKTRKEEFSGQEELF